MWRSVLKVLFLFVAFQSHSQTISIRGKLLDKNTQLPLESATVYVKKSKDSTVVDYTITDRNGNFAISVKRNNLPAELKISFLGYRDFKRNLAADAQDLDLGVVRLDDSANLLGEVVVKGETPPIRIKKDTLEFNASSFKVRPDSNVETLLKQLPGVEIDADGKIMVNGKEVKQILVNGQPFFDKDGKIALQNLPSDIINKVQVTDAKTKQEEIAGKAASSNDASINLTIDEDKNKGVFGKFMGGLGSSKRYESSLMFNYFKNKRKLSVLASSNNINSTGFSMNEIFDSMGGGRNSSVWVSDDGGFNINGMRFGGGGGITHSNLVGVNYADTFLEKMDFSGNYFYTAADTDNTNRVKEVTLLPDGNFTTESLRQTHSDQFAHNFNTNFEYKIDSTATLYFSPKVVSANARFNSNSATRAYNDSRTLNESQANLYNAQTTNSFANSIYFNKNLRRKGSRIAADFDHDNNKDEVENLNRSLTTFYNDLDNDGVADDTRQDARNQQRLERNLKDNYFASVEYQQRITDSVNVHFGSEYINNRTSQSKATFDYDENAQAFAVPNDSLSNQVSSRLRRWNPKAGFNIELKKFRWYVDVGTSVLDFRNESRYLGRTTQINKKYLLPFANSNLRYSITSKVNLYASYWYSIDLPSAYQILPVTDYSDPLNTVMGNAGVDPVTSHGAYFHVSNYDHQTKSGITVYGGGQSYENQVVSATVYDDSRKRFTTYQNVSGTYNTWFGTHYNKSFKHEAHAFKYSLGFNGGYNRNKGFANGVLYASNSVRFSPRINFNYDYGELFSINPTYNFTYSDTHYEHFVVDRASNTQHKLNLQLTSYWPKRVVFGHDFGYTYNSNIADGFKKDFLLWNVSLGYNFFSDKLLAKVKVYDLLDQNQSTTRTISAAYIRDEENVVLQRYVMFSLTYKLERFAGKKKEENHFWWAD